MTSVSALIRTKDREENLRSCLNCLTAQDYLLDDIIVVDDHSLGNTREVCEEMGVMWVMNEGAGLSAGLDTGLKNTDSDVILIIDDDNLADVSCVSSLMAYMAPGVGCVKGRSYEDLEEEHKHGAIKFIRESQRKLIMRLLGTRNIPPEYKHMAYYHPGLDSIGNCALVERQAMIEAGDGDERCGRFHDMDTWIRMKKFGYAPIKVMKPVTHHRQRKDRLKGSEFHKSRALTTTYVYRKHFDLNTLNNKLLFIILILLDIKYMALKSVADGKPWLTLTTLRYTYEGLRAK